MCVSKNIKVNQHNQLEITSQYIAKDKNTYRVVRPTHERIAETATFPQIIWLADVSRSPCFRAAVWAWSQNLISGLPPAQHNDVLGDLGEVLPQPRESRGHLAELTPKQH